MRLFMCHVYGRTVMRVTTYTCQDKTIGGGALPCTAFDQRAESVALPLISNQAKWLLVEAKSLASWYQGYR